MSWWAWLLLVLFAELVGLAAGWWLGYRSCERKQGRREAIRREEGRRVWDTFPWR